MANDGTPTTARQVLNRMISVVDDATSTETTNLPAREFLDKIRTGFWKKRVEEVRRVFAEAGGGDEGKKAAEGLKKELQGALPSGTFARRTAADLNEHSGIICQDLDEKNLIGREIEKVRRDLQRSPYILAIFLSPTGTGLKSWFFVPDDSKLHSESFRFLRSHILELTGVQVDESCKDVCRICFASYDPNLWIRPDSSPVSPCYVAELPPTSTFYLLHNTPQNALPNTVGEKNGQRKGASRPEKSRSGRSRDEAPLERMYRKLVCERYPAEPGRRNETVVELVTFLYYALSPMMVLEFVGWWYDRNSELFNDTSEEHMRNARAHLKAVQESFEKKVREEFTEKERAKWFELRSDRERDAFRICRDLAKRPPEGYAEQTFFLANDHLADRLGASLDSSGQTGSRGMIAWRILQRFKASGIISVVRPGRRRRDGQQSETTVWKWLLSA